MPDDLFQLDALSVEADLAMPKTCPKATATILKNADIPVPRLIFPKPRIYPEPGSFLRIQPNGWGLLRTAEKAYRTQNNQARLKAAERINSYPFNRIYHVPGQWPFEAGQIRFRPTFAREFVDLVQGLIAPTGRAPSGKSLAVIYIPDVTPRPMPIVSGSTRGTDVHRYWLAAARIAFDAWERLEALSAMPFPEAYREWRKGTEEVWFGRDLTPRKLKLATRRMGRIARDFQTKRYGVHMRFTKDIYGWSVPLVRHIYLHKAWCNVGGAHLTHERIQTFIHEIAHIVGISSRSEYAKEPHPTDPKKEVSKFIGRAGAMRLAREKPKQAIWTPDSYGYYALSRALISPWK